MPFIREIKKITEGKLVIAEDLGDITPKAKKLVENSTFPGMRVLQFGFLGDLDSPHLHHNYENNLVDYTGTHDNNTLLGFVWELEENGRKNLFDYFGHAGQNWDMLYDVIMRQLLASSAGLVIFPIQDILHFGSDTRLNTPGKAENNWAFRVTKKQIESIDTNKFRHLNKIYSRA